MIAYCISAARLLYDRSLLEAGRLSTGMRWGASQKQGAFSSEVLILLIRIFENHILAKTSFDLNFSPTEK